VRLAENRFLSIAVDLNHSGEVRSPAHIQVEFGRDHVKIFSLLGYVQTAYPRRWVVSFNRAELQPWWGAWEPALLALAGAVTIGALMLSWAGLATAYCWIAWLIGLLANRDLTLKGSWRLAGAALMPGALFQSGALVAYGFGTIDLVRLAFAGAIHFVVGWVYLIISPLWLPRHAAASEEDANPFQKGQIKNKKPEPNSDLETPRT
jgi:hypothetical protein